MRGVYYAVEGASNSIPTAHQSTDVLKSVCLGYGHVTWPVSTTGWSGDLFRSAGKRNQSCMEFSRPRGNLFTIIIEKNYGYVELKLSSGQKS